MNAIKVNENISLSRITTSDCDAMVEYLTEKEIFDTTLNIPYPYTMKDAEFIVDFFKNLELKYNRLTNWGIRNIEQKLIGVIGFHSGIKSHKAEIGYWLAKPYWGKGIMTVAVEKVCHFAFQHYGLIRITATVFKKKYCFCKSPRKV